MKIVCAAICKNEERNVVSFIENLKKFGIKKLCLVDTGSTDSTIDLFKKEVDLNIVIKSVVIEPFNFSTARNFLIDMIPVDADFVLHLDLDERIRSLPDNLVPGNGYVGDRIECLYDMVSSGMHKLTPAKGWHWQYPIHECMMHDFPVIFDNKLVIEHHQQPDKDCYESLTELYFHETPERLYFHRLTDLIHNDDYRGFVELFEKYGVWHLKDQQKWLAVKNYQMSRLKLGLPANPNFFSMLEEAASTSSWYYLFLCYDSLGEYKIADKYFSEAETRIFDEVNQKKYYNRLIKSRAEDIKKRKEEIYATL